MEFTLPVKTLGTRVWHGHDLRLHQASQPDSGLLRSVRLCSWYSLHIARYKCISLTDISTTFLVEIFYEAQYGVVEGLRKGWGGYEPKGCQLDPIDLATILAYARNRSRLRVWGAGFGVKSLGFGSLRSGFRV